MKTPIKQTTEKKFTIARKKGAKIESELVPKKKLHRIEKVLVPKKPMKPSKT